MLPVKIRRSWHVKREQNLLCSDPKNLRHFEEKVYSQNGEDGIVQEIFRRITARNRTFVEIGIQNATECNTRHLLDNHNWAGYWIEASPKYVKDAKKRFRSSQVGILQGFVTAENIQPMLDQLPLPEDVDLLSIDIDGNDYWVWKAIRKLRPRVVIIEYNPARGWRSPWIMPYNPGHIWDGSNYYGASLGALTRLGIEKGYCLVGCDANGVNAFFVRADIVERHQEDFSHFTEGAAYHYSCQKKGWFFGHPPRLVMRVLETVGYFQALSYSTYERGISFNSPVDEKNRG